MRCSSVHKYRLLPRCAHGLLERNHRRTSRSSRVAFDFSAFKILLGPQDAVTTECTWLVLTLVTCIRQPRTSHVCSIDFLIKARCFLLSFTGSLLRLRSLCRS